MKFTASLNRRVLSIVLFLITAAAPTVAVAQEVDIETDARLEGYSAGPVAVENDSTALIWLLFAALSIVTIGVMFKDPKRTHLD